jgi:hypothetical protein
LCDDDLDPSLALTRRRPLGRAGDGVGTLLTSAIHQPDSLSPQGDGPHQDRLIQSTQAIDRNESITVSFAGLNIPGTGEGYCQVLLYQFLDVSQQFYVCRGLRL